MDHIGVGHKTKNTVKHIYRSDYNLMKSYLDLMKYYIGHIGILGGGGSRVIAKLSVVS